MPGWLWLIGWVQHWDGLQHFIDRATLLEQFNHVRGPSCGRSMCHNLHVPQAADIVFVEYSLNDEHPPPPLYDNPMRRPFERLLRKLLSYPK